MITFLSSPKPFVGHADAIQRNAIASWKKSHPDVEVILYGTGEGVTTACHELAVKHVENVRTSPSGVPLFNSISEHARIHGRYDIQCYVNCDILFTTEIVDALRVISFSRFLVVGQRIDLSENAGFGAIDHSWEARLAYLCQIGQATLHGVDGMDYFVYPRGMWEELPPLVVGRAGYDGALIAYCLRRNIPLINGTLAVTALHQYHDYRHAPGGLQTVVYGEDARSNRALHDIEHSMPTSADAPWALHDGAVVQNTLQRDRLRRLECLVRYRLGWRAPSYAIRLIWRFLVAVGIHRPPAFSLSDVVAGTFNR